MCEGTSQRVSGVNLTRVAFVGRLAGKKGEGSADRGLGLKHRALARLFRSNENRVAVSLADCDLFAQSGSSALERALLCVW
jgi:hypothetical protein